MHNISLHPNKENPTAYYVRILSPKKKLITKLFSFKNDRAEALNKAKLYRNTVRFHFWGRVGLDKTGYIENSGKKRKGTVYRTGRENSSGQIGVVYQERPHKNNGVRKMWLAVWREKGVMRSKSFTFDGQIGAAKYRTSDDAKQLAMQHRSKMEELHYKAK